MLDSQSFKLPKLDQHESYETWHKTIVAFLKTLEVWHYINGDFPQPVEPVKNDLDAIGDYEKACETFDKWDLKNNRAVMAIRNSVSEELNQMLSGTAKDMYDTLVAHFATEGPVHDTLHNEEAQAQNSGLIKLMGTPLMGCCNMDPGIWKECWDLIEVSDFPLRDHGPDDDALG